MIRAACIAVLACLTVIAGCRSAPSLTDSLKKDRVRSLTRGVERAMQTQSLAADDVLESVRAAASAEMAAMEPGLAYDQSRRLLLRSQGRARAALLTLDKADVLADEVFAQWRKEIRRYHDAAVREEAERGLAERRQEFTATLKQIREAAELIPPVQRELGDRTLYFKHVRDEGEGSELPAFSEEGLRKMEAARSALRESTDRARTATTALIERSRELDETR